MVVCPRADILAKCNYQQSLLSYFCIGAYKPCYTRPCRIPMSPADLSPVIVGRRTATGLADPILLGIDAEFVRGLVKASGAMPCFLARPTASTNSKPQTDYRSNHIYVTALKHFQHTFRTPANADRLPHLPRARLCKPPRLRSLQPGAHRLRRPLQRRTGSMASRPASFMG